MGSRQENWFYHNLIDSASRGAHWRIIGSQISMSSCCFGSRVRG
jgi:alkaline phosphatase D